MRHSNKISKINGAVDRVFKLKKSWCCIFVEATKDFDGMPWSPNLSHTIWNQFLEEFGLDLARHRGNKKMVEEFLHHPPLCKKGKFSWR